TVHRKTAGNDDGTLVPGLRLRTVCSRNNRCRYGHRPGGFYKYGCPAYLHRRLPSVGNLCRYCRSCSNCDFATRKKADAGRKIIDLTFTTITNPTIYEEIYRYTTAPDIHHCFCPAQVDDFG